MEWAQTRLNKRNSLSLESFNCSQIWRFPGVVLSKYCLQMGFILSPKCNWLFSKWWVVNPWDMRCTHKMMEIASKIFEFFLLSFSLLFLL